MRDPISVSCLPHPLTCSFHREECGHLTTWQWVSQREQSESKYSSLGQTLQGMYGEVHLEADMSMSAVLCLLVRSPKPAQM